MKLSTKTTVKHKTSYFILCPVCVFILCSSRSWLPQQTSADRSASKTDLSLSPLRLHIHLGTLVCYPTAHPYRTPTAPPRPPLPHQTPSWSS